MENTSFLHQIRYLGPYLRPHRTVLIISLGLSSISTMLGMVQPYFAKLMIDNVFMAGNPKLLFPLLGALIALLIFGFLLRIFNNYIYTRYSAQLLFKMREALFQHLHRIPLKYYARWKSGDLFSRLASDMADIQALVTEIMPSGLFDFLTCVITAGILFWLNWRMALISFCFLPLALLLIRYLRPKLEKLALNIAEGNADISHFLFESLGGTALIRAFNANKAENQKLEQKHDGILHYLLRYQILGAISGSVPTSFVIVNSLVVFGYGGLLVLDGDLTLGSLMAFAIYQGRVLSPLQGLMGGFLSLQKSRVALSRVRELLDIEPAELHRGTLTLSDGKLKGAISFENVSFGYDASDLVVDNLSCNIPDGKITALVGPSGIGKSTICHLAMGLIEPVSGTVSLDDIPLSQLDRTWLARKMALISQDTFLFHTSILENIRFARPEASLEEVKNAARAACINGFIQTLPNGYDTEVGDRGVRLSGGQRQRISIARSVLIDPGILIMDEATAFLDTDIEGQLKETLRSIMQDRTILIISHHISAIEDAQHLIVLGENGITYQGPFDGYRPLN